MSDRLKKQIAVELEQLNQLLDTYASLLNSLSDQEPAYYDRAALATLLNGFYTGIENIFKRIVVECGDSLPTGEFWHRNLLDQMTLATQHRYAVISQSLRERLRNYLGFRHVFRQAYAFQLQWEKMSDLVKNIQNTLRDLEKELATFLNTLEP